MVTGLSINKYGSQPLHPLRVLVVDDNRDEAQSCTELLRRKGHQTHFAITGDEALDRAGCFAPQLVLLDLGMPGMDGLDVIASLRHAQDPHPPVVAAVTGYASDHYRRMCADAGFDQFVVKPVTSDAYDYLLWSAGDRANAAESLPPMANDRSAAFHQFSLSHLQFGHLILDFAGKQSESRRLASFDKVDRIQERTTIWLGQARGLTDSQLGTVHRALKELRNRLINAKFCIALGNA